MTPLRHSAPRAPGTRVLRPQAQAGQGLEALAAEFALLAQRRARMLRQIELLERQLAAAGASFHQIEARMSVLGRRIGRLEAGFTAPAPQPAPPPPPPPPEPVRPAPRPRFVARARPAPDAAPRWRGVTLEY